MPDASPIALKSSCPSLGKLVLLANSDCYSRARLDHYCKGQWYLLLLGAMVRHGYLDAAELWLISDGEFAEVHEGVTVRCFRDFQSMARHSGATDILWVRGDRREFLPVLQRMAARLWVYYAASKLFIPRHWAPYDVLLVDDRRHAELVRRHMPRAAVEPIIKTTDPAIFRPLPDVPKRFDLCMIGSIGTERKNYAALGALLRALPALKVAVVGRNGPDVEAQLGAPAGSITRFEFCERERLNRIMNECRAGFVPSRQDAAPRVIVEYIAAGVPVILNAKIFGGRDYVTAESGRLADEPDMPAIAQHVLAHAQEFDPRRVFEARFGPSRAAAHFAALLDRAIRERGRTAPRQPPGILRRLIERPWLVRSKLARCWRELESSPRDSDEQTAASHAA